MQHWAARVRLMDIAPSARISIAPPLADTPRAGTPAPEAVRTELPPDASVQQGGKGEGTGRTRAEAASSDPNDYLDRSVTIDIETHKVIYQAIDDRTGEVVTQIPDPSLPQGLQGSATLGGRTGSQADPRREARLNGMFRSQAASAT